MPAWPASDGWTVHDAVTSMVSDYDARSHLDMTHITASWVTLCVRGHGARGPIPRDVVLNWLGPVTAQRATYGLVIGAPVSALLRALGSPASS